MFSIKQCRQYIKIYKSKYLQHFVMLVLLMGGFHISWVKKMLQDCNFNNVPLKKKNERLWDCTKEDDVYMMEMECKQ